MKKRKSLLAFLVLIPLLLATVWFCVSSRKECTLTFTVCYENGQHQHLQTYTDDGMLYLFLPGNVSLADVTSDADLTADGIAVPKGASLEKLEPERTYSVSDGTRSHPFAVYQGDRVASVYIETATGTFEEIKEKKRNPIRVSVYDETGKLNYTSSRAEIKGRGHTTWNNADKKPFNIYTPQRCSVLGLDEADRFVLLANAFDQTNLKNKIALDLANQLGLSWNSHGVYTECYVNGDYQGLYLLCDKVEASDSKVNLDEDDYLIQRTNYYEKSDVTVTTEAGEAFTVNAGKTDTASRQALLAQLNQIEDDVLNNRNPSTLDTESFAKKYLLEQAVGNNDINSLYFYRKDGVLYSGPAWDYDLSNTDTESAVVFSHRRFSWYDTVYQNDTLRQAIRDAYRENRGTILSVLEQWDSYRDTVYRSSVMNRIRWQDEMDGTSLDSAYETAFAAYQTHLSYLDECLCHRYDHPTLRIKNNNTADADYLLFADEEGYVDVSSLQMLKGRVALTDVQTGATLDTSRPIAEDTVVNVVSTDPLRWLRMLRWNRTMQFLCLTLGAFLCVLAVLVILDIRRCRR